MLSRTRFEEQNRHILLLGKQTRMCSSRRQFAHGKGTVKNDKSPNITYFSSKVLIIKLL